MEFQLNRVNPPGRPAGVFVKGLTLKLGISYPGITLSVGSEAAGLIPPTIWLLIVASRLKPSRALLTRAGLKTWLSSKAARWRVTSLKIETASNPSCVEKGESS